MIYKTENNADFFESLLKRFEGMYSPEILQKVVAIDGDRLLVDDGNLINNERRTDKNITFFSKEFKN